MVYGRQSGGSRPLDVAIVEGIAEKEGIDPTDLGYSLQQYIDTDVLEALDATGGRKGEWRLRFRVADHTVTVDSEERVLIDGSEYR